MKLENIFARFMSSRIGILKFLFWKAISQRFLQKNLITGTKSSWNFQLRATETNKMSSVRLETCCDSLFFHQASHSLFLPKIKIISLMIKQHTQHECVKWLVCDLALRKSVAGKKILCGRSRFPPVDGWQSLSLTLFSAQKFITGSSWKSPQDATLVVWGRG